MTKKLKQARGNLLKAAKEIDRISKCYYAKKMKAMTRIVKRYLLNFITIKEEIRNVDWFSEINSHCF